MDILGVVIITVDNVGSSYTKEAISCNDFKTIATANTHNLIVIRIDDDIYDLLDYNRMIDRHPGLIMDVDNWEDFSLGMFLLSDISEFYTNMFVPDKCFDLVDDEIVLTNTTFKTNLHGYINVKSISDFNNVNITYDDNNLFIEKDDVLLFNSRSSIVYVNGIACYTTQQDNTFKIHNGNLLHNYRSNDIRDILIMEFENLGELKTYKLSECTKLYVHKSSKKQHSLPTNGFLRASSFDAYNRQYVSIAFKLPKNSPDGIPVLCIGGRLFYPNFDLLETVKIDDELHVIFAINRIILEGILSVNLHKQIPANSRENIARINVDSFLDNLFNPSFTDITQDCTIPFISIIQTDEPIYFKLSHPKMTFDKTNILLFPRKSNGILYHYPSRDMVDHIKIHYDSSTIVSVPNEQARYLNVSTNPRSYTANKFGFGWHNYNEHDVHNKFKDKKDVACLNNLKLFDIGYLSNVHMGDDGEIIDGELLKTPFDSLTFKLCGKPKQIWTEKKTTRKQLRSIDIPIVKASIPGRLNITLDGVTRLFRPEGVGGGIKRVWNNDTDPSRKLLYNTNLQCWIIIDDNEKTLYQSSLSANITMPGSIIESYKDPWDISLQWFEVIYN